MSCPLFILSERPTHDEELLGEPFISREGIYVRRLADQAGIEPVYYTYASLWGTVTRTYTFVGKPKVILLGAPTISLLLKKPTPSIKLGKLINTPIPLGNATAFPYYSAHYILNRGKRVARQTIEFFKWVNSVPIS